LATTLEGNIQLDLFYATIPIGLNQVVRLNHKSKMLFNVNLPNQGVEATMCVGSDMSNCIVMTKEEVDALHYFDNGSHLDDNQCFYDSFIFATDIVDHKEWDWIMRYRFSLIIVLKMEM
jgi:hypothetical protein